MNSNIAYIGVYSPFILFIISVFLLRNHTKYLNYFVAGFILNNLLNIILKLVFKEPRPTNDYKAIEIGVANGARIGFDKFGMPSGHAQNCAFCLAFITMTLNSPIIFTIYAIITLISCAQRYIFNNHTASQIIIGLLTGTFTGFIAYQIANKAIKGNIKFKKDDDGPL